ncbi:MAG TPA: M23 family metallopeptidase [Gemmatimonadales bacterium]|nr:M23 family metallopeptidase [Gemmatimonadales bacterium]
MKAKPRGVTIVVHKDGDLASKQYRLPMWAFSVAKWGALGTGLAIMGFFAFAGPIFRAAARAHQLDREVARLREENGRVQQLAAALNRAEANYQSLRQLLGGRAPRDTGAGATAVVLMHAVPVRAAPAGIQRYEIGPSLPKHWPLGDLDGFVTRGRVGEGDAQGEAHPGIDIAAPIGTPIRASGGGTVAAAGADADYGMFVLLRHPDGYETMYGHASRVLVHENDTVSAGVVIALTGNSGRSTAPHLHFEIRRQGLSLDPLTLVKQGN